MNFSYEEIFFMYGQYDTFVMLDFNSESEASQLFKPSLMGTFKYLLQERRSLEAVLKSETIPRSNQYIKFSPSPLENLSPEQIEILDTKGIQNSDIKLVSFVNLPRSNRFAMRGEKERQNVLKIPFDTSGFDVCSAKMGLFKQRLRNGHPLIPEKEDEFLGLQLLINHPPR
jgi:hypothetical protein